MIEVMIDDRVVLIPCALSAFVVGSIEAKSLTNRSILVTYDSPSAHYERACRHDDLKTTLNEVIDVALDKSLV